MDAEQGWAPRRELKDRAESVFYELGKLSEQLQLGMNSHEAILRIARQFSFDVDQSSMTTEECLAQMWDLVKAENQL